MSKAGIARSQFAPPEGWSQRKQRREITFKDQHDRKWHGTIETKTGDVTGVIQPLFQAPYIPEQKYISVDDDNPNRLVIDYDQAISDIRATRRDWEKEGRQRAQKIHGSKYNPLDDFSSEVLDIIGPPPQAWEPVLAAKQGNQWILGSSNRVDLRLIKFFEPEQLDPELRREREPDFSRIAGTQEEVDEETVHRTAGRGGGRAWTEDQSLARREQIKTGRPQPRAAGKGTGGGKNKPKSERAARPRYPQGHAKAGQFIPKSELDLAEAT